MNLPIIPADKANHVIYGAVIFMVVGAALRATPWGAWAAPAGAAAALLIGGAKEARDAWANRQAAQWRLPPPHSVSAADVAATVLGALGCWVAAWVMG